MQVFSALSVNRLRRNLILKKRYLIHFKDYYLTHLRHHWKRINRRDDWKACGHARLNTTVALFLDLKTMMKNGELCWLTSVHMKTYIEFPGVFSQELLFML